MSFKVRFGEPSSIETAPVVTEVVLTIFLELSTIVVPPSCNAPFKLTVEEPLNNSRASTSSLTV